MATRAENECQKEGEMSQMSVADSTRVSIQAHQNANDAKGREEADRPPERNSSAPVESPAVHIATSSTGEKAAELANMLDEMVKTTQIPRQDNADVGFNASEHIAEKLEETGSTDDLQAASEAAARDLADQVSSGLAQDKLSMTTPTDRNILQYLTG